MGNVTPLLNESPDAPTEGDGYTWTLLVSDVIERRWLLAGARACEGTRCCLLEVIRSSWLSLTPR